MNVFFMNQFLTSGCLVSNRWDYITSLLFPMMVILPPCWDLCAIRAPFAYEFAWNLVE